MIIGPFQLLFGLMDLLRRSLVGTLMLGGNISAFLITCSGIYSICGGGKETRKTVQRGQLTTAPPKERRCLR
jgi:hypothetical protein